MRGLFRRKWPPLKDLTAVCLNIGHCGLLNRAPIFCGLTDHFFLSPPFSILLRSLDEFALESHLLMCSAAKHFIREQASVSVVMGKPRKQNVENRTLENLGIREPLSNRCVN